ncbi:auxin-responsive protein SAUR50-like [Nymphaea colorata]|uniref:auxin-responsive protein SAUR50-like n=1 Tax=Nymphaea colorata TaxID=210225 RepID=UPI00129D4FFE|nr:auxin-responsive protein SAUR50-like [Nymphaea colorata]
MGHILPKLCNLTQPALSLGKRWAKFGRLRSRRLWKTDVPSGHFVVYVGDRRLRHVVPVSYLRHPIFRELLDMAADEFGFDQQAGLCIPCDELLFHSRTSLLEQSGRRTSWGFSKMVRLLL